MRNFWIDKRVCVTGGAGFLGSFIVEKLHERGAEDVFVPRSRDYDLIDPNAIQRMLDDSQPNLIIHAAAKGGGIGIMKKCPGDFFYENLMMGIPLLHAAWKRNIAKFVSVGTVCSYPKFAPVPFSEEDLWDGYPEETNAPYGLAKKMLLVQSQAYRQQHSYNSINLLLTNLYGPRDNFDLETSHVIPALIHKFAKARVENKPQVKLWGDGSPTREFLYVEDAAEGILLAAEKYNESKPVNLGIGIENSIKKIAETISHLVGYSGKLFWDIGKPNGQPRRMLDVKRAKQYFGFRAQVSLAEGLLRTIDWYKKEL